MVVDHLERVLDLGTAQHQGRGALLARLGGSREGLELCSQQRAGGRRQQHGEAYDAGVAAVAGGEGIEHEARHLIGDGLDPGALGVLGSGNVVCLSLSAAHVVQ